jgi:hypothetical protein
MNTFSNDLMDDLFKPKKPKIRKINAALANNHEKKVFTLSQIIDIKNMLNEKQLLKVIAGKYGTSERIIRQISRGERYPDIGPDLIHSHVRLARYQLTEDTKKDIRKRYRNGGVTQDDLAAEYGVSRVYVTRLINQWGR